MKSNLLVALVLAALPLAASAQQIYKWTDDKGVTHYGQTPPPNVKATVAGIRVDKPATAPQPAGKAADPAETPEAKKIREQRAALCKAGMAQIMMAQSQPRAYHADVDPATEARVRSATIQMRKNCDG